MKSVCKCGCGKIPKGKNSEYCRGHYIRSLDTIKRISGSGNPFYGRHHSKATKDHISESQFGKKLSFQARNKISESKKGKNNPMYGKRGKLSPFYGKNHTEETIKKISSSLIGRSPSNKTREKISKALAGRMFSNKTLRKMSKSQSGKNHPFYGKLGKYSSHWKGGKYSYWHRKAWKEFGKDYCEICGTTAIEYKKVSKSRFEMHNCLGPKNYTCMRSKAWLCLCNSCHKLIEGSER